MGGHSRKSRAKNYATIDEYCEADAGLLQVSEGTSDVERASIRSSEPCNHNPWSAKIAWAARHHSEHIRGDDKKVSEVQGPAGSNSPHARSRNGLVEIIVSQCSITRALAAAD